MALWPQVSSQLGNIIKLSDLRNSGNLQIVKSVSEHVDRVTNKVNVRHISQVLLAGV